jgi:hypothetical protein
MGAELELASLGGTRRVRIDEFHQGYRQTAIRPDEVITRVLIPLPGRDELLRLYKVSKRREMDMTTFRAAIRVARRDGVIDRAVAAARGQVRDRPDSWMPVLFMRLATGRIWYVPGFAGPGAVEDLWVTLQASIELGKCTPILGPGLLEPYLGSSRDLARQLAEKHHFPLAPHDREDLPQVAQYLAVNQGGAFPRLELVGYLRRELQRRFRAELEAEAPALLAPDADLDALVSYLESLK